MTRLDRVGRWLGLALSVAAALLVLFIAFVAMVTLGSDHDDPTDSLAEDLLWIVPGVCVAVAAGFLVRAGVRFLRPEATLRPLATWALAVVVLLACWWAVGLAVATDVGR